MNSNDLDRVATDARRYNGVGVTLTIQLLETIRRQHELLKLTREYICGCPADGDDPCECSECVRAEELLDRVDAELGDR